MSVQKFEAVLFDIDGTLVDSRGANIVFYQRILSQAGYPTPTSETIIPLLHLTMHDMIGALAAGKDESEIDVLRAFARTVQYPPELFRAFPYSREAVISLSQKYRLGLVTNRRRQGVEDYFAFSGLHDYFPVVVGVDDVEHPKPSPEPLWKALEELGVTADRALYVGDTHVDVAAARAAKMKVILYTDVPGADAYFRSYQELERIIERM